MRVVVAILLLVASVSASEITDAIRDLGAGKFAEREAGVQRLLKIAETDSASVLQQCANVFPQTDDPEVKSRLRGVMQKVVDQYVYRAPRGFLGIQIGNAGQAGGLNVQGNVVVRQGGALVINGGFVNMGAVNIEGDGKMIVNNVTITTNSGVWVSSLVPGAPAERAGMQPNDFITSVDGRELRGQDFIRYVQSKRPGTSVKLSVARGEQTNQMEVALGELPAEQRDKIVTDEGSREFFRNWLRDQTGAAVSNSVAPAKK